MSDRIEEKKPVKISEFWIRDKAFESLDDYVRSPIDKSSFASYSKTENTVTYYHLLSDSSEVYPLSELWTVVPQSDEGVERELSLSSGSVISKEDQFVSIMKAINKLSVQLREHDIDTKTKLDSLSIENDELKKILSHKYSATSLLHFSVTASIALIASLFVWSQFGIIIVHPALASIALIGTGGFAALSIWRKN